MIGIRADREFKQFLEEVADEDNRSLSNFVMHAVLTYLKEHKGIDWKKEAKARATEPK